MTSLFTEPPRANPDPRKRTTLDEVTELVKREEQTRLSEHTNKTAQLREARLGLTRNKTGE
ncbi:hypothetical protein G3545_06030 [Starkeya sp. ORNL1]|uniref:hypothetical protein n=1 Tax=Starkeya sp. ORNL1 TaxID=2709380 RepID=UPI001462DDD7|nr:hypothetical protein [Starkeya sp. ORNL1]QJP13244.1 hypothetical protein G3545_06030 [Starkeya sp. ORNL1]